MKKMGSFDWIASVLVLVGGLNWGLVGFFSFIGWFTLSLGTIPDFFGLKKWFMFYLISLIVIGFIVDKVRK